jgi:predicted metal-binding membrane protein
MVLIYASVARKAACEGTTLAPTGIFVTGYVVIWSLFSLGATIAQWALDRMALLSPMMMSNSPILGGLLLLTAGIYQLTPAKDACLRHCRSPVDFVSSHWKPGGLGALRMGIEHGGFCLGCCWTLMGLLFFGGVMSLWWIGGLTLFVLLEKVMPFGAIGGRLIGGIVAVWGLMALIQFLET